MTITLELPDETLSTLLFAARAQGKEAESLIVERLNEWFGPDPLYAPEGSEEESAAVGEAFRAIEEGRTKPFDAAAILRQHGLAD